MADNEKKKRTLWEQAVENALHFAFNLAFVFIFQSIFGVQNVLPGVAISVGMTMFPDGYIGVRPMTMAGIIIGLYCGCVIAGQTALMLPAAALVINFLFVLLIMALTCEPTMYKPAISFLLCLCSHSPHLYRQRHFLCVWQAQQQVLQRWRLLRLSSGIGRDTGRKDAV